jgi:hypothetical protein
MGGNKQDEIALAVYACRQGYSLLGFHASSSQEGCSLSGTTASV